MGRSSIHIVKHELAVASKSMGFRTTSSGTLPNPPSWQKILYKVMARFPGKKVIKNTKFAH